jgi:tetratricopeptide (TPR) repeat protein
MRPQLRSAAIMFLLTSMALAATESLPDLKARADAAHGGEQAKLCLEYAHRLLEDANVLFTNGDVDKAQGEVAEVVEYSRKAADAASTSGKHLKQTEIDLRKLSKRLHDIAATLAVEDRPPLLKAVDDIEQIRADLLIRMFGPQAEPKGKP